MKSFSKLNLYEYVPRSLNGSKIPTLKFNVISVLSLNNVRLIKGYCIKEKISCHQFIRDILEKALREFFNES